MPLLLCPEIKGTFEYTLLQELKNDNSGFFSNEGHINEPRVVAENVQEMCKRKFASCFQVGVIMQDLSDELTRRSMGDICVVDAENFCYNIDVKTHNLSTDFNMPNLTSIDRLSKYYSPSNTNYFFLVLLVEYTLTEIGVIFKSVKLFPIESLSWDCLQIEALGKGQIQIRNANDIVINANYTRKQWMSELYNRANAYYDKVVQKARERQRSMQSRANEWD